MFDKIELMMTTLFIMRMRGAVQVKRKHKNAIRYIIRYVIHAMITHNLTSKKK